jgi:hypothetical protein
MAIAIEIASDPLLDAKTAPQGVVIASEFTSIEQKREALSFLRQYFGEKDKI